jgi:peptidoglycan/xylan/chitin deacetylase (PgdA/CDA1 family)
MSLNHYPDYPTVTHREFGHRVGIFRVMEVLDRYGVQATVPMDAYTAEHYPILVEECQARGWELIGHGVTQRDAITSLMTEAEERAYLERSLGALRRASGAPVRGWLGPEYCESPRTPTLLAELGVEYLCDIPNDEQPYLITTPAGNLTALPVMLELGDVMMHFNRKVTIQHWSRLVREAFEVMYRDGEDSGRLLVLNLHPWCVGQAWRVKYLEEVVGHMAQRQDVWLATGSEIHSHFRSVHQ